MDKLFDKIEKIINDQVDNFETDPFKTSLKLIVIYWVLKKVWKAVR